MPMNNVNGSCKAEEKWKMVDMICMQTNLGDLFVCLLHDLHPTIKGSMKKDNRLCILCQCIYELAISHDNVLFIRNVISNRQLLPTCNEVTFQSAVIASIATSLNFTK